MRPLRILFVGGTGIISTACVAEALRQGHEVHLLNRGASGIRPVPEGAIVHTGDIRDEDAARAALDGLEVDVVAEFLAFVPEHIETDLRLFSGRTRQYIFVSSASAYQTPPTHLPVTESTPLRNPYWEYSRNKIACEDVLVAAYRERGVPITIVRPSHTYDRTGIPLSGGWANVERMRRGAPIVVHGDGTSLWTLTHHEDFARGFVPLLGNTRAIGEAVHITSDDVLTWDQITRLIASAAGVEPRIVHVPSDAIAAVDEHWGASLLGDKTHSMVFDNSKLRTLVPDYRATITYEQGAREALAWYDADPARRVTDEAFDAVVDGLVERWAL